MRLAVLDVDGVLVDARSSWRVVHEELGTLRDAEVYARLFWEGRISYADWMLADTQLWLEAEPRLDRSLLVDILWSRLGIVPDAHEAVEGLRRLGFEVALVSGGLDLVVERVAAVLGVRLWVSPRLRFDDRGRLLPGGEPLVEADAKHRWLLRFAAQLGVPLRNVVVIGDTAIDAPMMRLAGCGVAVRPHDGVVVRAAEGRVAGSVLEAVELIKSTCL